MVRNVWRMAAEPDGIAGGVVVVDMTGDAVVAVEPPGR